MQSTRLAFLNASVGVLLLLILGSVLLLPRFNYGELMRRQSDVGYRIDSLERDEESAADEFALYSAAFDEPLDGLRAEIAALQEQLSILSARVVALDGNGVMAGFAGWPGTETLRETNGSSDTASSSEEIDAERVGAAVGLFADSFRRPISLEGLSSEFRAKLSRLPEGHAIGGAREEKFLEALVEGRLLSYSSVDSIPGPVRQELHALFVRYQTMVRILSLDQDREISRLIVQANREGYYLEWPIGDPQHPRPAEKQLTGGEFRPGVTTIRRLREYGVQRLYRFAYEDFDEVLYEKPMENVRRHIFRDLYFLTQAWADTPADGL